MTSQELNSALRYLIEEALSKGFKKYHICSLTLGSQSQPQLDTFLKGTDLGFRPLTRIISSFGYELRLVPVPKNDPTGEINKQIEFICDDFLINAQTILYKALKNMGCSENLNKDIISELTNKILSEIKVDVENNSKENASEEDIFSETKE